MTAIPILTTEEVRALPNLGPWHVGLCPKHRAGGEHEGAGTQPHTCVAVRDEAGEVVDHRHGPSLDLMAAAPALRATALELSAENERLKLAAADAGKEADDFADEGRELCRLLGIDTSGDHDLVEAAAAHVDQVAQLNTVLAAAGYLPGLSGVQALLADIGEARRDLEGSRLQWKQTARASAAISDALNGLLFALGIHVESDCAPGWSEENGTTAAYAWGHALGSRRLAEFGKSSAPSQTPIRLEWCPSAEQIDLDVVAGDFRFRMATITVKAPITAEIFRYSNGRTSETIARDIPDAVNIITALFALRGITVPPFPEQT